MSVPDFLCNLKTCRRPLINTGWVTCCSHMFCEEDYQAKFRQDGQSKCPVCDTLLPNKYDVVLVKLNPSEEFKSMVLAGLRPEVILDITGRAMSFWAYQVSSERSNQERAVRKAASHVEHMQTTHEAAINALQAELTSAQKAREALEREVESLHCQIQGLRDALTERGRQLQMAQGTLSMMRRTAVNKSSDTPSSVGSDSISPSKGSSNGSSPGDVFSMEQSQREHSRTPKKFHSDSSFAFKPALVFPATKK